MQVVDTFDVGLNPQHVVPVVGPEDAVGHQQRRGHAPTARSRRSTRRPASPAPSIAVDDPYNMYFTPDGKSAIVVAEARKRLDFLDPHTMQLQSSLDVPDCAGVNHADFSIDGKFAIFTCEFQGSLVKIDIVNQLGRRLPHAEPVAGCRRTSASSPDGSTFYVAEMMRGGVYTIDPYAFTETGFIPTGIGTHGLYPSRDGTKLYVANRGRTTWAATAERSGQRVGDRLRHQGRRRHLADPGRRQPRHGQRERRRQDALAQRSLRRRRLRDQHHHRATSRRSRSATSRTVSPCGRSPAATRSATPATCASGPNASLRARIASGDATVRLTGGAW